MTLESATRLVGARLRPRAAGAILGLPASELCDVSPDAPEVLGRDVAAALLEELTEGSDPHALLLRAVQLGAGEFDPLVRAAVVALGHPRARVVRSPRSLASARAGCTVAYAMRWGTGRRCFSLSCASGRRELHLVSHAPRGPPPLQHAVRRRAGRVGCARAFLARVAEPDGGIPSVLHGFEDYPHAPWLKYACAFLDAVLPRPLIWLRDNRRA